MAEFRVGDVVQLKSGGPRMTITSINEENGLLSTTWFDGTRQEKDSFPLGAVLHAEKQRPNPRQGRAFFQKTQ